MAGGKLLVYLLRRDLRVSDNPILHHLATARSHGFTHVLPVYIFPAHQIEISGFIDQQDAKSPYPPARSAVGKFWRCGPHRVKFLSQAVWCMKTSLDSLGSGLVIRVGKHGDVLQHLVANFKGEDTAVSAVWMTEENSWEELREQKDVASVCADNGIDFKLWPDEKYFIDDQDTGLKDPNDLPDIFTAYRKSQEPLRDKPRPALPRPDKGSLPSFPGPSSIPDQAAPFASAQTSEELETRLLRPLKDILHDPPAWPSGAETSHPFTGGESHAWDRLKYLITSNIMLAYNTTRNGLTGVDFSTKLSAYLALGCITARQIHQELLNYEDGKSDEYKTAEGYGQGQNDGTESMRFELLWRDYMHLCTAKFGTHLFHLEGFRREADSKKTWLAPEDEKGPHMKPGEGISGIINRFLEGTTGMGFIDASQRELYNTGYTSNRTRQNVASFLTKHLGIDWRYGAEWYECMLVDHDVASNWSNWQYVAGVGNDPRGDARIFNPVKQAFDYDKDGSFVKMWLPEVRGLPKLENIFQPWTASRKDLEAAGLADSVMVEHPLKKIHFNVDRRPTRLGRGTSYPPRGRGRGRGRGGGRGGRGGGGGASTSTGNQENTSGDKGSGSQEGGGHTNHSSRGVDNGGRGGGRGQRGGSTAAFKARPGPTRPSPMSDDASARSSSGSKTDGSSGGIFPPATKIQQATVRPYNSAKIVNSSLRTKPNVASGPNRGHILAHGTGPWMAHPSQQHQIPRAQAQMQTRMHNHIQTWSQHHHGPQYQGHANSYHAEGGYDYHSPTSMHPYTQQPMTGPPMTGMPIVMGGQYMNRGYNSYPQAQSYPIAQPVWGDFGGLWQQPGGYVAQPAPQHSPPYYTMPPPHAGPAFSSGH